MTEAEQLMSLVAYLHAGSHKGAAAELGITVYAQRLRVSRLMREHRARTIAECVWRMRRDIENKAA